jgi:hypothetical protein
MLDPSEANKFGFDWKPDLVGPPGTDEGAHIQVTRTAAIKRGKGTHRALKVKTPKKEINVYVSPTGFIRVFDGKGNELKVKGIN